MMRILEITAFLALSGILHAATLTLAPLQTGGSGGGENGAADVTLQAATPTLAALVQDWDRPPDVSDAPLLTQPRTQAAPPPPAPDTPVAQRRDLAALPTPGPAAPRPSVETRLPAPVVPFAQTTPQSLSVPTPPDAPTPTLPSAQAEPAPVRPTLDAAMAGPNALPQVDTAPPSGHVAPHASLRPETRPDRPAPKQSPAKTQPQSAPRPAQKAQGSGSQPVTAPAPTRKFPAAPGPGKAQLAQAQAQWGAKIRSSVARAQRYPNGTRARGTVKLQITVSPSGQVSGMSVIASSGDRRLDQAAMAAVSRARLPHAPQELTAVSYRFNLPLSFQR